MILDNLNALYYTNVFECDNDFNFVGNVFTQIDYLVEYKYENDFLVMHTYKKSDIENKR